jgi:hypothetical protein
VGCAWFYPNQFATTSVPCTLLGNPSAFLSVRKNARPEAAVAELGHDPRALGDITNLLATDFHQRDTDHRLMKALLIRVGADQSEGGGYWDGPFDQTNGEFIYVPIPDDEEFHQGLAIPYFTVMHLDPDFSFLSYGNQGQRAIQISRKLARGDLIVFYAGLKDIRPKPQLVYAIIGLLVVDSITPSSEVASALRHENAHTRRVTTFPGKDIVVRSKPGLSGRCTRAIPVGYYADRAYRVLPSLLKDWRGLSVKDGYLQRSARLPEFLDADRFYAWFLAQNVELVARNN